MQGSQRRRTDQVRRHQFRPAGRRALYVPVVALFGKRKDHPAHPSDPCLQKPSKKTVPTIENLTRMRARAPQDLVALGKRGMVVERDGIYSLFSPSLERWIRQEIVAAPGEEETQMSAEEWLKSGKRDDLKEVKGVLPKFKKKYWPILGDIAKELSFEFAAAGAFELIKVLV